MLIGILLVKNETGRWLEQVLEQMSRVCDKLIFLDDCSTDDTEKICIRYGVKCKNGFRLGYSERSLWGTNEAVQRKRLWEMATDYCSHGDWILCLDADETIPQIDLLPAKIQAAEQLGADGLAFSLYDMWSPTHYRDDEYWTAHNRDWVMCVKYDENREYKWGEGLHQGRFPVNACEKMARRGLKLQHWGWSRPGDRQIKYERYKRADPEGKYGSLAQYESILDEAPCLKRFDEVRVLLAAPVRQDEETFKLYLESLDRLEIPENVKVDRFFIFHNSQNLIPLVDCDYGIYETKDEYRKDEKTHTWTNKNVQNIINMKNTIARLTLAGEYDYVFMVDTDLILHPKTLVALLETQKDIVAEIFWTKWTPEGDPLPNCWMFDSYDGVTDSTVLKWAESGLYKVGMTGACILIHRKVFEAGVNYNDIYNISYSGEDRFFGIRAACAGFDLWVDSHYPCHHLYRISEMEKYKAERMINNV